MRQKTITKLLKIAIAALWIVLAFAILVSCEKDESESDKYQEKCFIMNNGFEEDFWVKITEFIADDRNGHPSPYAADLISAYNDTLNPQNHCYIKFDPGYFLER